MTEADRIREAVMPLLPKQAPALRGWVDYALARLESAERDVAVFRTIALDLSDGTPMVEQFDRAKDAATRACRVELATVTKHRDALAARVRELEPKL